MSVADNYKFLGDFPSEATPGWPSWAMVLDDLTLAQAMKVFWLMEQFQFSVSGSTTLGDLSGTVSLENGSGTGCLSMIDDYYFESFGAAWLGAYSLGGSPTVRQPKDRVCMPARDLLSDGILLLGQYRFSHSSTPAAVDWAIAQLFFVLSPSSAYSGKWRVSVDFELTARVIVDSEQNYGFQYSSSNFGSGLYTEFEMDFGDFAIPMWGRIWANVSDGSPPGTVPVEGTGTFETIPSLFTFA